MTETRFCFLTTLIKHLDSHLKLTLCGLAIALAASHTQAQVIIDGESFEVPYSTTFDGDGKLEGQVAQLPGDGITAKWLASIGTTSTAIVQDSVAALGSQSVKVTKAANEGAGGGRWAVPVSGWPSKRYVCISWDMLVEDADGPAGAFGPFFGVEAYDDDGIGNSNGLMGSLGVDATTGDVLYQETGTGFLTETGATVNFGEWNEFMIDLDFQLHQYTVILNGAILLTEPFVDGAGLNEFTDADIAALAAAGDSVSMGLTGVAYFDNYLVHQQDSPCIPEPGTLALVLLASIGLPGLSRGRLC